jgi:hypothetical protein
MQPAAANVGACIMDRKATTNYHSSELQNEVSSIYIDGYIYLCDIALICLILANFITSLSIHHVKI